MTKFKIDKLPNLTKKIHKSQLKWRDKNWKTSLTNHGKEIEEILEKITVFSDWVNKLQNSDVAEKLMPEIFIDVFSSIHFACFGFYKYANMCLRSELETALRLIYFSTHPVEFKWWLEENKAFRNTQASARDVWGQGYVYFEQLEEIKKFEGSCNKNKKLFAGKANLKRTYEVLSQFIHTGAGHFQTGAEQFSPHYDKKKFKYWHLRCKEIQVYINILLILGFPEDFKAMSSSNKSDILNKCIGANYKDIIKQTLSI
jgi:hypothetical protein